MLLLILILFGVLSVIALLTSSFGTISSMEVLRYGTQNIQVESLP